MGVFLMGFVEDNLNTVLNTNSQASMSEAEAKVLMQFFDESNPLTKSELSPMEFSIFVRIKSIASLYQLEAYKSFLHEFLLCKIPLKRKRIGEMLQALKRERVEEKGLFNKFKL